MQQGTGSVSCSVAAGSWTATLQHRCLTRSPPAGTAARPAWLHTALACDALVLQEEVPLQQSGLVVEAAGSRGGQTSNKDLSQLEQHCGRIEKELEDVKTQIVGILADKQDEREENEILTFYQKAFTLLTEQNCSLKRRLKSEIILSDTAGQEKESSGRMIPDLDRTSPDGQEKEIDQGLLHKPSSDYETELSLLHGKLSELERQQAVSDLARRESEERTLQLEESLDLMRDEFERMEDYWQSKLGEERRWGEEREQQLQARMDHHHQQQASMVQLTLVPCVFLRLF